MRGWGLNLTSTADIPAGHCRWALEWSWRADPSSWRQAGRRYRILWDRRQVRFPWDRSQSVPDTCSLKSPRKTRSPRFWPEHRTTVRMKLKWFNSQWCQQSNLYWGGDCNLIDLETVLKCWGWPTKNFEGYLGRVHEGSILKFFMKPLGKALVRNREEDESIIIHCVINYTKKHRPVLH